ncbi:MAG: hypothetical protein DCF16_05715 [Alphaproteobacteria bacterium]|nr:MAG: hypothetical protein DCF16_05715 [Alphaproteobacteria bacterium]
MRKPHHFHLSPDRLAAFFAAARFWLFWVIAVVSRIGALNGSRRLRAYVNRAERWIERVLFLAAAARVTRRHNRSRRVSTPPGFRRARRHGRLLYKSARIRVRGTLAERLAAIAAALENPERIIARFMERLRRRLSGSRLVLTAPKADELITRAIAAQKFDSS